MTKQCPRCEKEFSRESHHSDWGWKVKKWCSASCRSNGLRKGRPFGERNHKWKGGRYVANNGYTVVRVKTGIYEYEHRIVMERHLGRKLSRIEVIHHINHNKTDNRLTNLLLTDPTEHNTRHPMTEERKKKVSDALKGREFTHDHRNRLSKAMKGNQNGRKAAV